MRTESPREIELISFNPIFLGNGMIDQRKESTRPKVSRLRRARCFTFIVLSSQSSEKLSEKFAGEVSVFSLLLRGGLTQLTITWMQQRQHHRAQESARERENVEPPLKARLNTQQNRIGATGERGC